MQENLIDEGHRTLIFAQTRKMLDIIQSEIVGRGWCFRRIDGTLKAADRELHVHVCGRNLLFSWFESRVMTEYS
jgi:SNF2 family DNA or RNA helicase